MIVVSTKIGKKQKLFLMLKKTKIILDAQSKARAGSQSSTGDYVSRTGQIADKKRYIKKIMRTHRSNCIVGVE